MTTRRALLPVLVLALLVGSVGLFGGAPAAAVGSVPATGSTAARCFVDAAHDTFLHRPATAGELTEWTDAFAAGTGRHVLVRELATSDEWLAVTVVGIYRLALERDPEPEGLAFWVGELRDGALVNRIGAQIFGSAEFYALSGGTDTGFVTALYELILDRSPDSGGVTFWLGEIARRGRGGVAAEFYGSYESRAMRVEGLYDQLLGRSPEPDGFAYWTDRLRTVNDVQLAVLIASTAEYAALTRVGCRFAIALVSSALPSGTVGATYGVTLTATGGQAPYTWSATGLPAGLAVVGSTIQGTPTAAGTASVTLRVTDAEGGIDTSATSLVVGPAGPVVTTTALPPARAGQPYTATLARSGGTGPFTWSAAGLPAGLTLSGATISGAPTTVGATSVTVTVTDAASLVGAATLPLTVGNAATEVDTGAYHTCAAGADGAARCWGFNSLGQTGGGGTATPVPDVVGAVDVAAGAQHSCAALATGSVRCWGSDGSGQLGNGAAVAGPEAVTVSGVTDAVEVDAEGHTTCARRSGGSVRCWGSNTSGQLGDGTTVSRDAPVGVTGLVDAVDLSVGASFVCAVRVGGTVVCWGSGSHGRLGGTISDSSVPVAVTGLTDAVTVSAGAAHACAVRATGTVVCWGDNASGQIGDGTTTVRTTPVAVSGTAATVSVSAGWTSTCAVRANGTVRCWGLDSDGALGQGTIPPAPVVVPTPTLVPGVTTGLTVEVGDRMAAVVGSDALLGWGQNGAGQVGDGGAADQPSPVVVPGL